MHFFTSSQCFWMALTLQNLKLGGNLEFSWYSCNILRYCSNRCIVWFFIPENCPAQANRKFPVQLYVKIQILFEPPFGICKWANHLSFLAMEPFKESIFSWSHFQRPFCPWRSFTFPVWFTRCFNRTMTEWLTLNRSAVCLVGRITPYHSNCLPSLCIWRFSTCHVEIKFRKFKVSTALRV